MDTEASLRDTIAKSEMRRICEIYNVSEPTDEQIMSSITGIRGIEFIYNCAYCYSEDSYLCTKCGTSICVKHEEQCRVSHHIPPACNYTERILYENVFLRFHEKIFESLRERNLGIDIFHAITLTIRTDDLNEINSLKNAIEMVVGHSDYHLSKSDAKQFIKFKFYIGRFTYSLLVRKNDYARELLPKKGWKDFTLLITDPITINV
jgi:hypothetical protein